MSRVKLRNAASRRFKSQTNATCLIWKAMMVTEMSFRKLAAPELVAKMVNGRNTKTERKFDRTRTPPNPFTDLLKRPQKG